MPLARVWETSDELERQASIAEPPRDRVWLHLLLLVATFFATTSVGAGMYAGYVTDFGYRRAAEPSAAAALLGGLWYSVPALLILGSHEMGHYLACRYYRINASLPYFIPAPLLSLFGTLGAVIRIRQPLRTKRMLFDVGVAGPIAGFVVLVPALIGGIAWSRIIRQPPLLSGVELGEPVLFQLVSRLFLGEIPEGYVLNAHPMAFAAIFGLLATALNLLPIGQLDGGHIAYANLGRQARWVTLGTLLTMLALGIVVAYSWLVWCLLMLLLLRVTGWQHPPIPDEDAPLGRPRVLVTIAAAIVFVLCFTPVPIEVTDLINSSGPPSSQPSASASASPSASASASASAAGR